MAHSAQQISALVIACLALSAPHLAAGRRVMQSAASSAGIRANEGPCDGIEDAEPRDSDPTQCKCSSSWHEVYCYDDAEPVAERKFEASVVLAACPSPYCARRADPERKRPSPCDGIEGAEPRQSDPTQCKCSSSWHEVYCYDAAEPVAERKFEASVVLAACPSPYCARRADPERRTPATTEAPPATEAPTTTADETTSGEAEAATGDRGPAVDPDMLIDAAQVIETSGGRFKCCEHSGAAERPKIQDITVDDLPRERALCMDKTGCGCMFGDKWHSYTFHKSSGKCRVTVGYLSSTIAQSYESILKMVHP